MFAVLSTATLTCGCTGIQDYVHNGFKVGPNYERPPAPVAKNWIDADDKRIRSETDDISKWWTVFNDPALDSLVCLAYQQNLTLREAAFRVLQARAQLGIAVGNLFPQTQSMNGSYTRSAISIETANSSFFNSGKRWYQQWGYNFNVGWELDLWGRLRRAVESNEATLDASVEDYDDVLVTLLGDVATNYIELRTLEQRIEYTKTNVELQKETLRIVQGEVNVKLANELDLNQAKSTLEQTEAEVPELEIAARLINNQLCILLGISPEDLHAKLGKGPSPLLQWMWRPAFPPISYGAALTCVAPSGWQRPKAPRSGSAKPSSCRSFRSMAPWDGNRSTWLVSLGNRECQEALGQLLTGISSITAAFSTTCACKTLDFRSWLRHIKT